MSTMLTALPTLRTIMLTFAGGIVLLLFLRNQCLGNGALFVGEDVHKINQPGDVEDFHVMLTQTVDRQGAVRFSSAGQQADNQGDAGAVDVIHIAEVEDNSLRLLKLGLSVSGVQRRFDFAV